MRRIWELVLAVLLLALLLAACLDEDDLSQMPEEGEESSVAENQMPEEPEAVPHTPETAVRNNSNLTERDIRLIQFEAVADDAEMALIKTTKGDIKVVLYREQAPKTVENFVSLAQSGYYNGVPFYKILNYFLVQTGDPTGTGTGGSSSFLDDNGNPAPFEDEFSLDLWHFRGALSMHNDGPNSNTSRFSIVQAAYVNETVLEEMHDIYFPEKVIEKYAERGGIPGYDWRYTVFGMVLEESLPVVDAIANTPADENGVPREPVMIESITIAQAQFLPDTTPEIPVE